jgi:hypothetical protein
VCGPCQSGDDSFFTRERGLPSGSWSWPVGPGPHAGRLLEAATASRHCRILSYHCCGVAFKGDAGRSRAMMPSRSRTNMSGRKTWPPGISCFIRDAGVAGWVAGDRYPIAHMAALDSVRMTRSSSWRRWFGSTIAGRLSIADSYRSFSCVFVRRTWILNIVVGSAVTIQRALDNIFTGGPR